MIFYKQKYQKSTLIFLMLKIKELNLLSCDDESEETSADAMLLESDSRR